MPLLSNFSYLHFSFQLSVFLLYISSNFEELCYLWMLSSLLYITIIESLNIIKVKSILKVN